MQFQNLILAVTAAIVSVSSSCVTCAASVDSSSEHAYNNFLSCISGNGKSCVTPNKLYSNETEFIQQHKHLSECLRANLFSCKKWVSGQTKKEKSFVSETKRFVSMAKKTNKNLMGTILATLRTKADVGEDIILIHENVITQAPSNRITRRDDDDDRSLFQKIKDGILAVILLPVEIPAALLLSHWLSGGSHCYYDDAGSHCRSHCFNDAGMC